MNTNKKFTILQKKEIFYTIVFILSALGIYVARLIENHSKIVASGILGFAVLYLMYSAFVLPRNTTGRTIEFEDLEFPRDIKYLFYGFFGAMIMFWAGSLILDLVRYLLGTYAN